MICQFLPVKKFQYFIEYSNYSVITLLRTHATAGNVHEVLTNEMKKAAIFYRLIKRLASFHCGLAAMIAFNLLPARNRTIYDSPLRDIHTCIAPSNLTALNLTVSVFRRGFSYPDVLHQ